MVTEAITPPPQRRRWLQFGLRSMLVAITVLAISLGVIVRRAERQRRAVERIESLGGTVWYDYQYRTNAKGATSVTLNLEPKNWSWARRLLGNHYFDTVWRVQAVEMRLPKDANGSYRWLGPLPVQTKFSQAPTEAIGAVGQLRSLKSLDLSKSRTTDADLQYLLPLARLERLDLNGSLVTDEGLSTLRELKQLKTLSVRDTGVTAAGVSKFRFSMPNCLIQANAIALPKIDWGLNPLDTPTAK